MILQPDYEKIARRFPHCEIFHLLRYVRKLEQDILEAEKTKMALIYLWEKHVDEVELLVPSDDIKLLPERPYEEVDEEIYAEMQGDWKWRRE